MPHILLNYVDLLIKASYPTDIRGCTRGAAYTKVFTEFT